MTIDEAISALNPLACWNPYTGGVLAGASYAAGTPTNITLGPAGSVFSGPGGGDVGVFNGTSSYLSCTSSAASVATAANADGVTFMVNYTRPLGRPSNECLFSCLNSSRRGIEVSLNQNAFGNAGSTEDNLVVRLVDTSGVERRYTYAFPVDNASYSRFADGYVHKVKVQVSKSPIFTGGTLARVWLDGTELVLTSSSTSGTFTTFPTTGLDLVFGARKDNDIDGYFTGKMQAITILKSPLSEKALIELLLLERNSANYAVDSVAFDVSTALLYSSTDTSRIAQIGDRVHKGVSRDGRVQLSAIIEQATIVSCTAANPGVLTTSAPHGWDVGQEIEIEGTANAALDGFWRISAAPTSTSFTIEKDCTTIGPTIVGGTAKIEFGPVLTVGPGGKLALLVNNIYARRSWPGPDLGNRQCQFDLTLSDGVTVEYCTQGYFGLMFIGAPLNNDVLITPQPVGVWHDGQTPTNPTGQATPASIAWANGVILSLSQVCGYLAALSVRTPIAAYFPVPGCAPGLGAFGISAGFEGKPCSVGVGTAFTYSQSTVSPLNAAWSNGTVEFTKRAVLRIGNRGLTRKDSNTTCDGVSMVLSKVIITPRRPLTLTEMQTIERNERVAHGLSPTPPACLRVLGDSTSSNEQAIDLGWLPSITGIDDLYIQNLSIAGIRYDNINTSPYHDLSLARYKTTLSTVALLMCGINDVNKLGGRVPLAEMQYWLQSVNAASRRASGADYYSIASQLPLSSGVARDAVWDDYISNPASGFNAFFRPPASLTGTTSRDGIHPNNGLMQTWSIQMAGIISTALNSLLPYPLARGGRLPSRTPRALGAR